MSNSAAGNAISKPVSPIDGAVDQAMSSLHYHHALLDQLCDRLERILEPREPAAASKGDLGEAQRSPLHGSLLAISTVSVSANKRLESLLERLTV